MAVLHLGTMTTLAEIASADISNNDVAYVWHANWSRKLVFDSTSTKATDTDNHPYFQRPSDYSTSGVWIEEVGADQPQAWNGSQIRTGAVLSTDWDSGTSGMMLDLDNERIAIKDSAFGNSGIQIGWISDAAKLNVKADADNFLQFDGAKLTWKAANTELDEDGNLVAESATLSGEITAESGAIGGWDIGETSLTSTNIGLHSGANPQILLGNATTYNDAKIGMKSDGSGKLANGNIAWDAAGDISFSGSVSSMAAITGGTIQTATSGARAVLSSTGLAIYDASAQRAKIGADGSGWLGASDVFSWDTSGVLNLSGFTPNDDGISVTQDGNTTIVSSGTTAFTAGPTGAPTFTVTQAGILTATGANISGAISASTIDIGGADATSFHVDVDGNMWLGAATFNIGTNPFAVSNAGVVRAVSGTIGGLTLSDSALYTGSKTVYNDANAGIHFGTDGIGIGNNVFTVSNAGALVATSALIGGSSSYVSFTGGALSVQMTSGETFHLGGSLELSVGADITLTGDDSSPAKLILASESDSLEIYVDWENHAYVVPTDTDVELDIGSSSSKFYDVGIYSSYYFSVSCDSSFISMSVNSGSPYAIIGISDGTNDYSKLTTESDGSGYEFTLRAADAADHYAGLRSYVDVGELGKCYVLMEAVSDAGTASLKLSNYDTAFSTDAALIPSSGLHLGNSSYSFGNIFIGDDKFLGLGSSAGRIVFDTTPATDEINFLSCNVGMNTEAPYAPLHVVNGTATALTGTVYGAIVSERAGATSSNNFLYVVSGNAAESGIRFGDPDDIDIGGVRYDNNTDKLSLYVNNATRMVIDSTGNVGINVTTPSAKLDLSAVSYAGSQAGGVRIGDTDANWDFNVFIRSDAGGSARGSIGFDSTESIVIRKINGRVGIGGVTSPSAQIHVDQSATTGAVPVLTMDQADVSEEFIKFIGTAASSTLTQSIVAEADVTTATRAGFLKISVQDDGNQITDQTYYLPIYTLA